MSVERKNKNEVLFVFPVEDDAAKEVYVAGDFNGWDKTAKKMVKRDGGFRARLALPPGSYQYLYVVDGVWRQDPTAAGEIRNAFGTFNSVARI